MRAMYEYMRACMPVVLSMIVCVYVRGADLNMNACMSGRVGVRCKFVPVYRSTGTSALDPCARKSLSRRQRRSFLRPRFRARTIDRPSILSSTSTWVGSLVDWMWRVLKDLILIHARSGVAEAS